MPLCPELGGVFLVYHCARWRDIVVVVVLTLTRIIKSVVRPTRTGSSHSGAEEYQGKTQTTQGTDWYTRVSQLRDCAGPVVVHCRMSRDLMTASYGTSPDRRSTDGTQRESHGIPQ